MKNEVARAIFDAHKEKSVVLCNIRLKKNGRFSSVEGVVEARKVSKDGNAYVIIQPEGKHMQSVLMDNILSVRKDDVVYRR